MKTKEDCRVFHAPELHMGKTANWQKSMPVLTEAVIALRLDGQVQIFQCVVAVDEDKEDSDEANPHYEDIVTAKYRELFNLFNIEGEAFNISVKSVQDAYCVITITRRLDSENRIPA